MAKNKAILTAIKKVLDDSDKLTKKDFLKAVGIAFDENKPSAKPKVLKLKGKKDEKNEKDEKDEKDEKNEETDKIGGRKVKKVDKDDIQPEDKPKRKLSDYQQFAKDQLAFLKQREDAKEDAGDRLRQKDLMKLVAKRWRLKKEGVEEEEWDERIEAMDD